MRSTLRSQVISMCAAIGGIETKSGERLEAEPMATFELSLPPGDDFDFRNDSYRRPTRHQHQATSKYTPHQGKREMERRLKRATPQSHSQGRDREEGR